MIPGGPWTASASQFLAIVPSRSRPLQAAKKWMTSRVPFNNLTMSLFFFAETSFWMHLSKVDWNSSTFESMKLAQFYVMVNLKQIFVFLCYRLRISPVKGKGNYGPCREEFEHFLVFCFLLNLLICVGSCNCTCSIPKLFVPTYARLPRPDLLCVRRNNRQTVNTGCDDPQRKLNEIAC